jgi:hypothetical protein
MKPVCHSAYRPCDGSDVSRPCEGMYCVRTRRAYLSRAGIEMGTVNYPFVVDRVFGIKPRAVQLWN